MIKAKNTTSNTLQIKQQEQVTTNNGVGESFRVLYYGPASSVPFVWESQPGTPKHALTEPSLPPLTPPPSYYQFSQKYNSTMNLSNDKSLKTRSSFLRTIFVSSPRKRNMSAPTFSSCSVSSSSSSSASSYLHSSQSTPTRKKEARSRLSPVKFGLEDEFGGGCLGGGFKNDCRIQKMKKVMMSFVRIGKA